jgi:hypothetical protein
MNENYGQTFSIIVFFISSTIVDNMDTTVPDPSIFLTDPDPDPGAVTQMADIWQLQFVTGLLVCRELIS